MSEGRKNISDYLVLLLAVGVLLLVLSSGVRSAYSYYLSARYPLKYTGDIVKCYEQYGLHPAFVAAVIYEESRFNPEAHSVANAVGLMQIVPETGGYLSQKMGENGFAPEKLKDTSTNIAYGCHYLSLLFEKYRDKEKVLAAYNAGPGSVDAWIAQGEYEVHFEETKNFVERVRRSEVTYRELYFPQIPD